MLLKDTKTDQGRWCSHACACRVSALSSACTRWMWCRTSSIGISGFVLTIAGRIFRCPAFTSSPSSVFRWTPDFCTDMHTSRYSKKARADTVINTHTVTDSQKNGANPYGGRFARDELPL